jgi:hypothetical protein
MTSFAPPQLSFNFEPKLADRFPTLREYVAHRSVKQTKLAKVIACDMDMSPTTLSRKLNPREDDTQRFNLDDLEGYLKSTGDVAAVIEYLVAKYMDSPDARRSRMLSHLESLLPELVSAIASCKE